MPKYVQFDNAKDFNQVLDNLYPILTINPNEFLTNYFDISTCDTEGLDNWGRILDISRIVQIQTASNYVFGFKQLSGNAPLYPRNFNNGIFYNPDNVDAYVAYSLSDYQYRAMLRFRYKALTSNMSSFSINRSINDLLQELQPEYKCFVTSKYQGNTNPMFLFYLFNFALPNWLRAILSNTDVLPIPAGVNYILINNALNA